MTRHDPISPNDPLSTNIAAVRSKAWGPLQVALAEALDAMGDDHSLVLTWKDRPWFVQFAVQGPHSVRVEMVSNHFLREPDELPVAAMVHAVELGWQLPTGSPELSTPELDPDGSPNFFVDLEGPGRSLRAAELAVETLVEVFRVPHPQRLRYRAYGLEGETILLPTLRVEREVRHARGDQPAWLPRNGAELCRAIEDALRELNDGEPVIQDDDHDWPLHFDHGPVYVHALKEPYAVVVYSWAALHTDQDRHDELLERVNQLNAGTRLVTWSVDGTGVMVRHDLPGDPFSARRLVHAVRVVARAADEVGAELCEAFGAHRHHPDDQDPTGHDDEQVDG